MADTKKQDSSKKDDFVDQKTEKKPETKNMTVDEQIINAYQTGSQSLQDLARIYKVDINHVLLLTGNENLATVHTGGDLVDQQEAGPHANLSSGEDIDTPITLNQLWKTICMVG